MSEAGSNGGAGSRVLYCHCAHAKVVPPAVKEDVLGRLARSGVPFEAVPDLCAAAACSDPALAAVAGAQDLRIAACYPRAVRWLFHAAGAPLTERVVIENMREEEGEAVAENLLAGFAPQAGVELRDRELVLHEGAGTAPLDDDRRDALLTALLAAGKSVRRTTDGVSLRASPGIRVLVLARHEGDAPPVLSGLEEARVVFHDLGEEPVSATLAWLEERQVEEGIAPRKDWMPWFPVIDHERCTNCMQCLSFCLFDVYGVDDAGRIEVRNEDHCKTNCPACSRVCPEVAILFPKYTKGPINGDVVKEEDLAREAMKVDISALLGGNIYDSLRQRSATARQRFSTERDESKALLERKRCLQKMKMDLDIPDEVLMTLPSAGDIEDRLARARAKQDRRIERSQSMKDERQVPTEDEWGI